jgi:hypothetical protein
MKGFIVIIAKQALFSFNDNVVIRSFHDRVLLIFIPKNLEQLMFVINEKVQTF